MSRACFIAVLLDECSTGGSAVEAHVRRIAKLVGAQLAPAEASEVGPWFTRDAHYVAEIRGSDEPSPSPEGPRALVAALLEADDVAAVRVGWWHLGDRRAGRGRIERIEVGTLDAADWDGAFTVEVRRGPEKPGGATLRELALGIRPAE